MESIDAYFHYRLLKQSRNGWNIIPDSVERITGLGDNYRPDYSEIYFDSRKKAKKYGVRKNKGSKNTPTD